VKKQQLVWTAHTAVGCEEVCAVNDVVGKSYGRKGARPAGARCVDIEDLRFQGGSSPVKM